MLGPHSERIETTVRIYHQAKLVFQTVEIREKFRQVLSTILKQAI